MRLTDREAKEILDRALLAKTNGYATVQFTFHASKLVKLNVTLEMPRDQLEGVSDEKARRNAAPEAGGGGPIIRQENGE